MTVPGSEDIPTTRLARTARIGGLAASQTAKYAGTRAANVGRPQSQRKLALDRRHLEAADQLLAVLGTMKGPAMKLGQILSFVDLGMIPADVRPQFQQRLATLCNAAPPIGMAKMEPVLEKALGAPVSRIFRRLDPNPIGIASIGQVYRATMWDGREVAVKVQYPRIVSATRADMKNLAFMLRRAGSLLPGLDTEALAAELSDRVLEELDYSQEAKNHQELAASFAGHPFIMVPPLVAELSGPQVVVTELVEGADFEALCAQSQEQRDRAGEILVRFYFGSMLRLSRFSGDPHPGNIKVPPDGRIAFFDFGSFKQLDARMVGIILGSMRAVDEGRPDDALRIFVDERILDRPDRVSADLLERYFYSVFGWMLEDAVTTMTPDVASNAVLQFFNPARDEAEAIRGQRLPTEWALMARTAFSTTALLGQLGATGNWNRLLREWTSEQPQRTPLGQLDDDFFDGRLAG
jgi:predicted unusual protein kinase regulating ubiquinone biosynthesis (AarF/ABC1/UbiB family)